MRILRVTNKAAVFTREREEPTEPRAECLVVESRPYGSEAGIVTFQTGGAALVTQCAHRFLPGQALRLGCSAARKRRGFEWGGGESPLASPRLRCGGCFRSARITSLRPSIAARSWLRQSSPRHQPGPLSAGAGAASRSPSGARREAPAAACSVVHCAPAGSDPRLVTRPGTNGQHRYACAKEAGSAATTKPTSPPDRFRNQIVDAALSRLNSAELSTRARRAPSSAPETRSRWRRSSTPLRRSWSRFDNHLRRTRGHDERDRAPTRQQIDERSDNRHVDNCAEASTAATLLNGLVDPHAPLVEQWDLLKPHPPARDPPRSCSTTSRSAPATQAPIAFRPPPSSSPVSRL